MAFAIQSKQILCALLLAAATAASGSAWAQSAEYRRGYDQGYRDGAEAQSHADHGDAGRIIIEEAHYGARDAGFCDARESIQRSIGWRRHADVLVNNELCGDPAHGVHKHLEIRYRCGHSQPVRTEAPEDAIIALSCE